MITESLQLFSTTTRSSIIHYDELHIQEKSYTLIFEIRESVILGHLCTNNDLSDPKLKSFIFFCFLMILFEAIGYAYDKTKPFSLPVFALKRCLHKVTPKTKKKRHNATTPIVIATRIAFPFFGRGMESDKNNQLSIFMPIKSQLGDEERKLYISWHITLRKKIDKRDFIAFHIEQKCSVVECG